MLFELDTVTSKVRLSQTHLTSSSGSNFGSEDSNPNSADKRQGEISSHLGLNVLGYERGK